MTMVAPWLCDESGNPLDEWQRALATSDDAHIIINAGPGSGKTRVLVAHYLHLLMTRTDWDVNAVVAITFTEKAAAEMKDRVSKVLQRIVREWHVETERKRAHQLLDSLPEAPIGTIHSFCARLLRQFAVEANLDPSFQVLDDLQASILRRQVCQRWLWTSITQPLSNEIKENADAVVAYWGFDRAVGILTELLKLRPLIEYRRSICKPMFCQAVSLLESEKALERCYNEVVKAYEEAKREINGLDFDDLLLRTWWLLRGNPEVLRQVRRQHFRILVDELQDTDRVQVEILSLLCGWDERESPVKFFGVGDSQQSIYAFRNADVGVFNELWERARCTHGWRAEKLSVNYRSLKPLVDLTNHAFERIFVVSERGDASVQRIRTRFQRMDAHRKETPDEPCIEFAFFQLSDAKSKWQRLRAEAEWIAQRIVDLNRNGKICYRDIAILLRELVNAGVYEDALRRYGIPYHIIAGYGFFEAMEARDLLTFLQVIAEPDDEVAWFAWLRSPMVGVSDETLFWLRQGDLKQLPEEERTKVERAKKLRDEAARKVDKVSVRELLEWILRETRYDVLVAALPQGRQRLANIRKFLRMAQEISDGLKLTVRGLVRYARQLVEGAERIGEPPLAGASTDAVQLMTIHAAKGLEFPVVIVPMLGEVDAPQSSRAMVIADPEHGIAVRRYNEAGESLDRREMPNYKAVDDFRKLREGAELERLLFVAWTRAKDRLILVGAMGDEKGKGSKNEGWQNWLQLVVDTLQVPVRSEQSEFAIADGVRVRLWATKAEGKEVPTVRPIPLGVRWLEGCEPVPDLPYNSLDLPLAQLPVIRLSVTDLLPLMAANEKGGGEEQAALELGLVVHALLRYGIVEPDERQLLWVAQTVGADTEKVLQRTEELKSFVKRAKGSRAFQQAQRAQRRWHELEFRFRLNGSPVIELVGRWDLLAELPDRWLVVDFKTDAVRSLQEAQRRFEEGYVWQALAYAFAAHRVFGASSVEVAFLFVALDEPNAVRCVFNEADWAKLETRLRQRALEVATQFTVAANSEGRSVGVAISHDLKGRA
jgi:ATP-dependent exoDNAse (exonuclease V) beta subunit